MTDYVSIIKGEDSIQICLYNTDPKVMEIGEKMNALNEEAYMNGYNWEAFFNYYLAQNAPDVLEEMGSDPEADMYAAFYPLTPDNELRAKKFAEIIQHLIENEDELYCIVEENGDEIEWD